MLRYKDFSGLRDILRYTEIWREIFRGKEPQKLPLEGKIEKYETQGEETQRYRLREYTQRYRDLQRRLRETWGGNDSDIEIREGKHRHRDSRVDSETDIWVETLRHKD